MNIESIFRIEENLKKYNAVIPYVNLNKKCDWSHTEGSITTFSETFRGYAGARGYRIPEFLYFHDKQVLLIMHWLDSAPSKKDINNRNDFMEYISGDRPKTYITRGEKKNIKSVFGIYHKDMDYEIRNAFLIPYDLKSECQILKKEIQEEMIFYRFNEYDSQDSKIHQVRLKTDNPQIAVEVEFIGDKHGYFQTRSTPQFLLFGKIPMRRLSLKDACVYRLAPFEPGVYAIIHEDQIKKIGMTTATLFKRLECYYYPELYNGCGEAGKYLPYVNRDEIEVAWLTCPAENCRDMERDLHFLARCLDEELEWQINDEFSNKRWQHEMKHKFIAKIANTVKKRNLFAY